MLGQDSWTPVARGLTRKQRKQIMDSLHALKMSEEAKDKRGLRLWPTNWGANACETLTNFFYFEAPLRVSVSPVAQKW